MTTPIDPTTTRRREEAAEKYNFIPASSWEGDVEREAFLAGCEHEAPEAEKSGFLRAVELTRTPEFYDLICSLDDPQSYPWADWLESQAGK